MRFQRSKGTTIEARVATQGFGLFLLLLLSADLLFIALHLIRIFTDFAQDPGYAITADRGFGEIYQLVKTFWIVVCLMWLTVGTRQFLYGAWGLLFCYVLLDDWFMIHERVGVMLAQTLQFSAMFNLRPQDFGEVAVFAAAGLSFLVMIGVSYRFSSAPARAACRHLLVLLGVLVVVGIVFDLLNIMMWPTFFGLLEDGGEMIVISLICWYVFSLAARERLRAVGVVTKRRAARCSTEP